MKIKLTILLIAGAILTGFAQDRMTPELLWKLGRVSGTSVSPDGLTVLYGVTYYDLEANKGNRDLYTVPVAGGAANRITNTEGSEGGEVWRPDGNKIGFLRAVDGDMQLFEMNPDGSGEMQVTDMDGGISNFAYSPDQTRVYFTRKVKTEQNIQDKYPDLPKADARVINDLMYRHWDEWDDYMSNHLFVASYSNGQVGDATDIMKGEPYDTPLEPFGGSEEISWSPDGKNVAYTCKKLTGKEYAESTNSDIYMYNLESGKTTNISEGMMGYDQEPVFSPSGRYMLWNSMEHAGFESDRSRIFLYDMKSGGRSEITTGLDRDALHPAWSPNETMIYFESGEKATYQLFSMDLSQQKVKQITQGAYNYHSLALVNGTTLIAGRMDMNHPTELYRVDGKSGKVEPLTSVNKSIYDKIKTSRVEERWIETTDGKQMLTWVIYPPDFDKNKKYPTLLYCQGGPQSAVSQFFSYRWNFQLMAANGYIIVAPNRRGLPSFGREWNNEISRDWGGQAMKDYLTAIDTISKEPYADENRLGAVGASFGGYSVFWLAGHHDGRFKCFIAHDGVFNLQSMYLTTEEMWFVNWDLGGPPWDPELKQAYHDFSPVNFIQNWDTPIMIIHGEQDFRVPVGEGMQAFQAVQLRGIPSKFLYFPEEGHWVLSPQNGVLWHREFFAWLDRWLK